MKKLLITGFEPFGGQKINPSWLAVSMLEDVCGKYSLTKLQIPTVFKKASQKVIEKADKLCPDVILCVGLAGGRNSITPEVVAINLMDANIADNEGNKPINEPILQNGENAYFSNLPIRKIVENIKNQDIPTTLSYSCGAFVCNEVLYTLLHHYKNSNVKVGFLHVPFLPEQTTENKPSLTLEQIVLALKTAILTLE